MNDTVNPENEDQNQSKKKSKINLTTAILISLVGGLIFGIILNLLSGNISPEISGHIDKYLIHGLFTIVGKIFISSIKMMVVPLVFVSLVCGVTGIGDIGKLGRVGGKTLAFYLFTTATAIALALLIANMINPGEGLNIAMEKAAFSAKAAPALSQVIIDIVPTNVFESMVKGTMLQIIFFSMLTGLAIASLGKKAASMMKFMNVLNDIIMQMVTLIMLAAPYGIFCLIAKVFATQGFSALLPLIKYMGTVFLVLFVHLIFVYSSALRLVGGLSVLVFFKKFYSTLTVAFSTASSNATIPVTMRAVTERMGVSRSIASFSIPFGATINMDGTAIMQGVAVIFISQVYGINLSMGDFLTVIMTATLASIGTAGVPGVGLITLSMVLTQVGLPVEGIALIMGVDRLLDMARTAVNISGDAIVSLIVAKSENELDIKTYYNPKAGTGDESHLLDEIDEHLKESEDIYDNEDKEWKKEHEQWDSEQEV